MEKIDLIRNFEITIHDDNDNAPEFATNSEKPLREDAKIGDLVTIATASDDDAGDNSRIAYSIVDGEGLPFAIDPFTGEVRTMFMTCLNLSVKVHHASAINCLLFIAF